MEKRFYWLKLKDNFFQEDAIEWLEEQQNGKEYVLFYLKLCLKSLRNNGVLVRKVGDILIPYDVAKLAEITKTNPDTVVVAMEILKKIGLVDVYQNGEIYMKCLSDLVGSESASREAVKKREQRKKLKEANMGDVLSPDCPTDCPTEYRDKSIEYRDKEKDDYHHPKRNDDDEEKTHTEIFSLWEKNIMPLTPIVGEKLQALLGEVGEAAVEQGILAAVEHGARNFAYVQTVARNYVSGNSKKQDAGAGYSSMDLVNELYGDVGGEGDAATAENSPNDC